MCIPTRYMHIPGGACLLIQKPFLLASGTEHPWVLHFLWFCFIKLNLTSVVPYIHYGMSSSLKFLSFTCSVHQDRPIDVHTSFRKHVVILWLHFFSLAIFFRETENFVFDSVSMFKLYLFMRQIEKYACDESATEIPYYISAYFAVWFM